MSVTVIVPNVPSIDNPPAGANPAAWRRYCEAAQRLAAKPKRKRTKRSRRTRRTLANVTHILTHPSAAQRQQQATGAATIELVERVNERHESILVNLPDGWKVVA